MKLWEIQAQALRLMFADSDLQFNLAEFQNSVISSNPNTRDKLVRMNDSIRRGIDTYYSIIGEQTAILEQKTLYSLSNVYYNKLHFVISNVLTPSNFGFPTRIDVEIIDTTDPTNHLTVILKNQIDFIYNQIDKIIFFEEDYARYYNDYDYYIVYFKVWYKVGKANIPADTTINAITYELDTLNIPAEVQRLLPFYVKSELYEEDEFNVAQYARQQFFQGVSALRKPFNKVQTKVKKAKVFNK
jgi:hypothetical protein